MKVKRIEFEIIGEIKTKQRPRATIINGHATVYTPKDTLYYENYIKAMFLEKYPNFKFNREPLNVSIICFFKINQEMAKYSDSDLIPCKTHKDLDNIGKTVLDALNGVAFDDDKQITVLNLAKYYTKDVEKIKVSIVDESYNYQYLSLSHIKDTNKLIDYNNKIEILSSKEKLNKADSERLSKYTYEVGLLKNKLFHETEKYNNDK